MEKSTNNKKKNDIIIINIWILKYKWVKIILKETKEKLTLKLRQ